MELLIKKRAGLIRKRFEDRYLILDGVTGRQVKIGEGLSFKEG
ncbi:MAG: hypothetical protein ACUVQ8_03275 [Nitrososphaeria archaeon]